MEASTMLDNKWNYQLVATVAIISFFVLFHCVPIIIHRLNLLRSKSNILTSINNKKNISPTSSQSHEFKNLDSSNENIDAQKSNILQGQQLKEEISDNSIPEMNVNVDKQNEVKFKKNMDHTKLHWRNKSEKDNSKTKPKFKKSSNYSKHDDIPLVPSSTAPVERRQEYTGIGIPNTRVNSSFPIISSVVSLREEQDAEYHKSEWENMCKIAEQEFKQARVRLALQRKQDLSQSFREVIHVHDDLLLIFKFPQYSSSNNKLTERNEGEDQSRLRSDKDKAVKCSLIVQQRFSASESVSSILDFVESQAFPFPFPSSFSFSKLQVTLSYPKRSINRVYELVDNAFDDFVMNGNNVRAGSQVEVPRDTCEGRGQSCESHLPLISDLNITDREVLWVHVSTLHETIELN